MSGLVATLIGVLLVWMAACAWCGFGGRFKIFAGVLLGGLVLNQLWLMIGLKASFLEPNLIFAQFSAFLYGIFAFGCGWLAGRVARQFRASRIEDA